MPTTGADGARPPLLDLLHTVPSPLVVVLVGLAPSIARLRRALDVFTWRSSWQDSVLALALLWAVCLYADITLRYLLPLVACAALVLAARTHTTSHDTAAAATEDTLNQAINDLSTVYFQLSSLYPSSSINPALKSLTPAPLLRLLACVYIPYLLLTRFVRLRILIAIIGTGVLTWRSRWAAIIRRSLTRSAHLRRLVYRIYALLTGLRSPIFPIVSAPIAAQSLTPKPSATKEEKATTLRFLFTLYENQRWWVGLDFTAALLPGERPSWSTAPPALLPTAPPAAFTLPPSTTVYLPDPQSTDGKGRIKRTAKWRWEEDEWRVVLRTPVVGSGAEKEKSAVKTERVERPVPVIPEEGSVPASAAGRILSKMRQASLSANIATNTLPEHSPERHSRSQSQSSSNRQGMQERSDHESSGGEHTSDEENSHVKDEDDSAHEDCCTDPDGWVYGDNKWEGLGAKGGMGKYTRYRRWTRVAVLYETIEHVGPGSLGVVRGAAEGGSQPNPSASTVSPKARPVSLGILPVEASGSNVKTTVLTTSPASATFPGTEGSTSSAHARTGSMDDRLRQRLRAAVQSATAH
ncbi:hypothetical protein EIP86_001218 [Pleurotus ostreatoroseus]|nr:hypothetical protein EIP86_001218 [Pleurotus ostreatoroseus]